MLVKVKKGGRCGEEAYTPASPKKGAWIGFSSVVSDILVVVVKVDVTRVEVRMDYAEAVAWRKWRVRSCE